MRPDICLEVLNSKFETQYPKVLSKLGIIFVKPVPHNLSHPSINRIAFQNAAKSSRHKRVVSQTQNVWVINIYGKEIALKKFGFKIWSAGLKMREFMTHGVFKDTVEKENSIWTLEAENSICLILGREFVRKRPILSRIFENQFHNLRIICRSRDFSKKATSNGLIWNAN